MEMVCLDSNGNLYWKYVVLIIISQKKIHLETKSHQLVYCNKTDYSSSKKYINDIPKVLLAYFKLFTCLFIWLIEIENL